MVRVATRMAAVVVSVWCVWLLAGRELDRSPWITLFAQVAGCGSNPIVCENQLPGDTDFDVAAAGDSEIQGFAADFSVNVGQTVGFKIQTASTNYQIAIYRLGFYRDAGARKITTLGPFHTPQPQRECLTDSANGLVADSPTGLADCANWSVTASWSTNGATSGVYVAKLTRLDGPPGSSSHIVFVVRDDARKADLLFQTSDTTWQAYNQWGGGSLYCGGPVSNAGTGYACDGRAVKVSYNRPMDTRAHDPQSFLFNAEYPMLRWLEANGFDVKYWSGVDTDRSGANLNGLLAPKAFLSVGHDEYWSANQRASVVQARNAGVNLAFFSGNEMYWKTRWEPSRDAAHTAYRTLVSYKETLRNATNNDPLDPLDTGANPITTATWRDTRFGAPGDGGRPENAVTGTIWTVNCCSSEITVPASMSHLHFWRNTRVASLAPGTEATLAAESLGYEWDEDLDNGSRPAGLVRLSSSTRSVDEKVLDFGSKVGPGTATHSLTLYRHASNALVFGAGTVQWSWGLDGDHDRGVGLPSHTPDQAMQQATLNLFADMDVNPASLQVGADPAHPLALGVKSTDTTGPTSAITSPLGGAAVRAGDRVVITGIAVDQGLGTVAAVEVSVDGGGTWKPADGTSSWAFNWSPGAVGPVTIRSRAIDDSGNIEAAAPAVTITVDPGTCPCTTLWPASTVPPIADFNDPTALEIGVKFRSDIGGFVTGVRYYKSAGNIGTHIGNLWATDGTRLATATFVGETTTGWQQVTFGSPVPISANTTYIASYHTDSGHYAALNDFFTATGVDSPPLHALTSAAAGGNGVFVTGPSGFPNQSFRATNYWVDVVFSPTSTDAAPPVIFDVRETTIDSASALITWTTNESATSRVEYSTDPAFPPGGTLMLSNGTFVTAHRLTINRLTPNTTYFYRVFSTDRAGNPASVIAPSFTVPGPTLRDTALADFSAGQHTSTYAAEMSDGELILAPAAGNEFSGTTLPPGWIATPWSTGGTAIVGNGVLGVDGSRVSTCENDSTGLCTLGSPPFGPGRSLEFVAQFSSDAFQHAGLGVTFLDGEPWAMFSTLRGEGGLSVRTSTGTFSHDELLRGAYIGAPHQYRIDWNADGSVTYFIDGTQVAAHPEKILQNMRPVAASDFTVGAGKISVDWVHLTPYAAGGTFLSRVFDASAPVSWHSIQWTKQTPPGTAVAISIRTGDTATPDATWTGFVPVATPGALTQRSRFIQYRAQLTSSTPGVTPSLDDIIVTTGQAPLAQPDSASVQMNGTIVFAASGPGSLLANDTDADAGDVLHVLDVTQPSHGAVLLNADESVTYAPALNYQGPDSFVYTVSDGLLTATATVSITVRGANVAPVANPDAYTINEDTSLTASAATGVLANDTDADHNTLSAILVATPAHGTLALNSDGSFTYTPQPNYAGPDAFGYKANDGTDDSNTAAVQITINQVNDPPLTVDDAFATVMNQTLTVSAPGLLRNDRDIEVEDILPLHTVLGSTANAHGTVTLGSDGSFTYVPERDFAGIATFTYSAVDHFGAAGAPGVVTINVQMEAITAQSVAGGTVTTGTGVSADDPLQAAVTTPSAATVTIAEGVISSTALPSAFTFLNRQLNVTVLNADGTEFTGSVTNPLRLSFTIDASLVPAAPATLQIFRNDVLVPDCLGATTITSLQRDPCITRRETNANGNVLIALLSTHASRWNMGVTSTNPAPVARNDASYFTPFGMPLVVPSPGVLGNDYGRTALTAAAAGVANGGTVALAGSGGFTFTPSPGFCGAASFGYIAADGNGLKSATGTATVRVNCDPIAGADSFSVLEDSGSSALTVLANDSDPEDGTNLKITAVTQAAHGTVAIAAGAGWVTYVPQPDFFGSDSFTYTVSDTRGDTATATVTVTVKPVDDVPRFVKGGDQTVLEDAGAKTVAGWATGISAGPVNESAQTLNFIVTTNNDALFSALPAIASNGTLTFTPAVNANGSATVTVALHDNGTTIDGGVDTSASQTFVITVTAVNDAPTFVKGADQTVLEDSGPRSVAWATTISAGPADEAAQTLTFTVTNDNAALFTAAPAVSGTGVLTFTPAATASGSSIVTVKLQDSGGTLNGGLNSSIQTFLITVKPVNDAPSFLKGADQTVLEDAGAQTVAGWATAMSAGPASEAGQTLTFDVTTSNTALFAVQPAITPAGTLSYTPALNASGSATVTVVLRDGGGTLDGGVDASAPQTFTINVTAVNDAPSFVKGLDQTVLEDAGAKVVTAWASSISAGGGADESTQVLTFNVTNSNNALFNVQPDVAANGTLTFTPAPNASGSSIVTVRLQDNGGIANAGVDTSAAQTFAITVTAVNDAPSFIKGLDQTVLEDAGAQVVSAWATSISAGGADESAQVLTFTVTNNKNALFSAQPAIAANGTLTFTPAPNANGSAIVTVTLKDDGGTANGGVGSSAAQTFTVAVTAVNDAPVASGQTVSTAEDTAKAITLAATDVDGDALTYTVAAAPTHGTLSGTAPALTYTPASDYNGTDSFTFTATDPSNAGSNVATVSFTITPVNDPPIAGADSKSVRQDKTLTFLATDLTVNDRPGPADESSQTLTVTGVSVATNGTVSLINGTVTYTPAAGYTGPASFGYTICDNGTTNGVADARCASGTSTVNVTVLPPNVAPTVAAITWTSPASVDGVKVGTVVSPTATFSDAAGETHTAVWAWGDGTTSTGTVNETTRVVTGSHTYTTPKLYTVTLTVTDSDGASGSSVFQYVVVVNPLGGSETGIGSISSPAGSFTANPSLAGTANINFTAKYGADGTLANFMNVFQFNYTTAKLNFQSTNMRWLVVSGSQSWLKGEGTSSVSGVSEVYYFLLSVVDSVTVADKVRVKIWNKATGKVIYDNHKSATGASPPDDAVATVAAPTGAGTITFLK
jgi:VCBS repeat-containing protein